MKNFKYTLLLATAASLISTGASAAGWSKDTTGNVYYDDRASYDSDYQNEYPGSRRMDDSRMVRERMGYLTDEDVKNIQQALLNRGYNAGPADGVIGAQTTAAIRAFQRDNGLMIDGRIHQSTIDRLGVQLSAYEHNEGMMDRTAQQSDIPHYILIEPAAGDTSDTTYDLERDDVRSIQRALMNRGYNPGPLDGVWGSRTDSAFMAFKRDNGMGYDDRISETALNKLGFEIRERNRMGMNMPEVRYESGRHADDQTIERNRDAYQQ